MPSQFTMNASATTTPTTADRTPTSKPATSHYQHRNDGVPRPTPEQQASLTRDFHLDTFFNPVWMPGPHVFSFAENGTVVRPKTYETEPYPGYHAYAEDAERTPKPGQLPDTVDRAARSQGTIRRGDEKPWKNVAITEQDDAEYEAMRARAWARANAVGEREQQMYYGRIQARRAMPPREDAKLVYTWPPPPPQGRP